jgi:hypothetical protein
MKNRLTEEVIVVDTDLRKQHRKQIASCRVSIQASCQGCMISGVGSILQKIIYSYPPILPNPMEWRHLLATSSVVLSEHSEDGAPVGVFTLSIRHNIA